ncbi:MAG: 3-keto-5-aminohexanoate cleavage protein [Rhizobiaceae bacterium]
MTAKAIVTCALTGVLTDPARHPVPVTASEMAAEARRAFEAGAAVMHVHFRRQEPGLGHLPSWEPALAADIIGAIRAACPGVLINQTTGVIGADIAGPVGCLAATRPEIAACNAGSLNYLKTTSGGRWAWPPMLFDNPVAKVTAFLDAMRETGSRPEFECFDTGMVRSVGLYAETAMFSGLPKYNFVMGVASGMPADPDLLPILARHAMPGARWSVTAIGRDEIWPLHEAAARLGGDLRTGVEDTFYLPDGSRTDGNGPLVEAIVAIARGEGRAIASPDEARAAMAAA